MPSSIFAAFSMLLLAGGLFVARRYHSRPEGAREGHDDQAPWRAHPNPIRAAKAAVIVALVLDAVFVGLAALLAMDDSAERFIGALVLAIMYAIIAGLAVPDAARIAGLPRTVTAFAIAWTASLVHVAIVIAVVWFFLLGDIRLFRGA